tara:strand:+ start:38 stop:640 length:603 start_codon:yes stop_codon:yes gene_type:complete
MISELEFDASDKNNAIYYKESISLLNKNKVAKYIFEANKEFYNLFGKPKDKIYLNLCDMIIDERTEEFNTKSIFIGDRIIGIISFYDSEEIYYRQIFSLNYLQNDSSIDADTISSFSKCVPVIKKKSLYLSRIAISEDFQGKGYSTKILKHFEREARNKGYSFISLHVHFSNKKAISIYKKYGFHTESNDYDYFILLKEI